MTILLARIISLLANILILIIFVDAILSFFLSPYHPVRSTIDRIIGPMLTPIRRIVPLVGSIDLSPLILIVLIEILSNILVRFLYSV
jgi:YggT family protein